MADDIKMTDRVKPKSVCKITSRVFQKKIVGLMAADIKKHLDPVSVILYISKNLDTLIFGVS